MRHRKRCEKQEEHKCTNCQFYTKIKEKMVYHIAKKHALSNSKPSTVCFLVKIVCELLLSPTTSKERTWSKAKETK